MGSREYAGYCSYTKAIEHLGERWTLLIVRQLGAFGPQGFNALAAEVPGRISRSVLIDRLRRLETLGVVSRTAADDPQPGYRLTAVGHGLMATLDSLRAWSETWLPDDPEMIERDPDVVLSWLAKRVDGDRLPRRSVVLQLALTRQPDHRYWLVLERGLEPYGCLTDPLLDESRYVYVDISMPALLALASGRQDWAGALRDGSAVVSGDPLLANQVASWFRASSRHSVPGVGGH